ncbi:MAG: PHP domain-containing protein [Chloroflexi bacterium]|nr:PHP domain-containing protein [Chloroflexota bacterium]
MNRDASIIDLHLHTTASDGMYSPRELVDRAVRAGLRYIAVTDHDTVDGVAPAIQVAKSLPLEVIAGIELSTEVPRGEVHVLGYFIDPRNPELQKTLDLLKSARWARAQEMVARLASLGLGLDWDRLLALAGKAAIGRPHIAQALVDSGYVTSIPEAFEKYIGRGGPAYVDRYKLAPTDAIGLLSRSGGVSSLAHPADIDDLGAILPALAQAGLAGLEAYYHNYSPSTVRSLLDLAAMYDLVPTGGSDHHGWPTMKEAPVGGVFVPPQSIERLRALHEESIRAVWRPRKPD